jgi:hypothetical protein
MVWNFVIRDTINGFVVTVWDFVRSENIMVLTSRFGAPL